MAAIINLVSEQEIDIAEEARPPDAIYNHPVGPTGAGGGFAPSASPAPLDPRVVAYAQAVNARLAALEGALTTIPQTVNIFRILAHALGSRVVMFVALLGALGLAVPALLWPDPMRLAIFGGYAVLVYLPLAAIAYFGGNK